MTSRLITTARLLMGAIYFIIGVVMLCWLAVLIVQCALHPMSFWQVHSGMRPH